MHDLPSFSRARELSKAAVHEKHARPLACMSVLGGWLKLTPAPERTIALCQNAAHVMAGKNVSKKRATYQLYSRVSAIYVMQTGRQDVGASCIQALAREETKRYVRLFDSHLDVRGIMQRTSLWQFKKRVVTCGSVVSPPRVGRAGRREGRTNRLLRGGTVPQNTASACLNGPRPRGRCSRRHPRACASTSAE